MNCPKCDKEPFELFKPKTSDLGLLKSLQGYLKCIHCGAVLKKKYGKTFWFLMGLTIVSFIAIYALLKYQPFDLSILPGWFFIFILVYMLVLIAANAYSAIFTMRFEEVPESEMS